MATKATIVEVTTAKNDMTIDAAGVSSERLRRATAATGTVKAQIDTASEGPASAKAIAIAKAEATVEARVSIKR
eukprot:677893-Pleurochrysis_carterae.AAC.1